MPRPQDAIISFQLQLSADSSLWTNRSCFEGHLQGSPLIVIHFTFINFPNQVSKTPPRTCVDFQNNRLAAIAWPGPNGLLPTPSRCLGRCSSCPANCRVISSRYGPRRSQSVPYLLGSSSSSLPHIFFTLVPIPPHSHSLV